MPTNTVAGADVAAPEAVSGRRLPPLAALVFYALPAAIAWVWLQHADPGRSADLWWPARPARCLGIGVAAGLLVAGVSQVLVRSARWARRLESEFGKVLGAQGKLEVAWLAVLSGVSEEYFFRGALQGKFGFWAATAVFAVLHWPLNRGSLPWPLVAGAIGAVLGGICLWTGSLLAPAAAHAVINGVNLWRITDRFRDGDEAKAAAYVEGGCS